MLRIVYVILIYDMNHRPTPNERLAHEYSRTLIGMGHLVECFTGILRGRSNRGQAIQKRSDPNGRLIWASWAVGSIVV